MPVVVQCSRKNASFLFRLPLRPARSGFFVVHRASPSLEKSRSSGTWKNPESAARTRAVAANRLNSTAESVVLYIFTAFASSVPVMPASSLSFFTFVNIRSTSNLLFF
jgi:hypothetical protein